MEMSSTLKRLAALAALGTIGTVAPVAGASAASTPVAPAGLAFPLSQFPLSGFKLPAANLPAFSPAGLSLVGPSVGQLAAVIGPTVFTTAPSKFINTNIQTSAGSSLTGGQAQ
jgi:hypothetical protein